MKSGRSLVSLAQELERQMASKKDLVVSSALLRHDTDDTGNTRLVIEESGGTARYGVTPLARRQLADKLKIPFAYFERMRGEQPVLLADAVKHLVAELAEGDAGLMPEELAGEDYTVGTIVDAAQTPPFFGDRRVVVARGIGRFSTHDVEPLVDECRRTGVDIELVVEGTATDVSAPEGLTVYRIVQEAQFVDEPVFRDYYERLAKGYSSGLTAASAQG